jgi:hypothetical protein
MKNLLGILLLLQSSVFQGKELTATAREMPASGQPTLESCAIERGFPIALQIKEAEKLATKIVGKNVEPYLLEALNAPVGSCERQRMHYKTTSSGKFGPILVEVFVVPCAANTRINDVARRSCATDKNDIVIELDAIAIPNADKCNAQVAHIKSILNNYIDVSKVGDSELPIWTVQVSDFLFLDYNFASRRAQNFWPRKNLCANAPRVVIIGTN